MPKMSVLVSDDLEVCCTDGGSSDDKPLVPVVRLRNTHIAAVSSLLYIVVFGMVSAYSAPAAMDMKEPGSRFIDVTPDQISWIASLPQFSAILGNCLSGYTTNRFGRKMVVMFISVSYVVGWLIIAYATSIPMIYVGRLMTGFYGGICCVAVPAYVVEIAPTEIRGRLTSGFQLAFTTGVLLVMSFGTILRWSWLAILGATVATCAACLMAAMPESPTWLIRKGRTVEALKALKFLKGKDSDYRKELEDISANLCQDQGSELSWKSIVDPAFYKPVAIALALTFFQQFSGINALMAYAVDIFSTTKSSINPRVASSVAAAFQVAATVVSAMLMDKFGRKKLFISSGSCMTVALVTLGLYSYLSVKTSIDLHLYGWVPLASFIVYIISFSMGVGPIPFVMAPEMAPIPSRCTVIAIASVSCSVFGFIVTKVFEDMRYHLGLYGVYWTYGAFSLLSALFGCFVLPETKGLTIHQIHRSFSLPVNSL